MVAVVPVTVEPKYETLLRETRRMHPREKAQAVCRSRLFAAPEIVGPGEYRVESLTNPGTYHTVTRLAANVFRCTCPSLSRTGCHHIEAVKVVDDAEAEREFRASLEAW